MVTMNKYIVGGIIVVAAAVGAWQREAIREAWETRGMTDQQKQEREDAELDEDLEGLGAELDEEASASVELDELETQE